MSQVQARGLFVVGLSALAVGILALWLLPRDPRVEASPALPTMRIPIAAAVKQEVTLTDVGKFRVGSELGEERAGFSGMPTVFVFASAQDANWPAVRECLEIAEQAGSLEGYTPVLVDAADPLESQVEWKIRQNGAQVVIRSRQGRFFGALQVGFNCGELLTLLDAAKGMTTIPPRPSPLRLFLRQEPIQGIDTILASDGLERAQRVAELFREFDGDTDAVRAVEARLTQ